MTHKLFVFLALSLLALLVWANLDNPRVYHDEHGRALAGHDPVSYFSATGVVPGRAAYRWRWRGAKWWFASGDSLQRFRVNPERYAPAYGGYAALEVAHGRKTNPDLSVWQVFDGRLYFFTDRSALTRFRRDPAAYLPAAERYWPRLADRLPGP